MTYKTKLVSVTQAGVTGHGPSGIDGSVSSFNDGTIYPTDNAGVAQSSDGRYVVFTSDADNFYQNDTNHYRDIFLKDMVTGVLTPVFAGNYDSVSQPDVSDDGRFVVMQASGSIYLRDMTQSSSVTVPSISVDANGTQIGGYNPQMSNDGLYIVFNTSDSVGNAQVYLYDTQSGHSQLISEDQDHSIGDGDSTNAAVSNDGKFVVFESNAANFESGNANAFREIYLKNVETGVLTRISEAADHTVGTNGESINATFSGNGRYVVFQSGADGLDTLLGTDGKPIAAPAHFDEIYRKDLITGNVELVSEGKSGATSGYALDPSISADGRFVLFRTYVAHDPAINPLLVSTSMDYQSFYYIKDMATGNVFNLDLPSTALKVGIGSFTGPAIYQFPYQSQTATISADGKYVTLSSIQSLDVGKVPVNLNNIDVTNNDTQYDVFRLDVSSIASKPAAAQTIPGSAGSDTLVGGMGADILKGLGGDDIYKVDLILSGKGASALAKIKQIVNETAGNGSDTINLFGSITGLTKATVLKLIANVENLDASGTGTTWLNLIGNTVDNSITGNAGNNILNGNTGNDVLFGGVGSDIFMFDTKLTTKIVDAVTTFTNVDTISDFLSGTDAINLSKKIFTKAVTDTTDHDKSDGLTLASADLVSASSLDAAKSAQGNAHFLYDSTAHALYFDVDGSGAKAPIEFAVLTGINTLAATDLHVV